MTFITDAMRNMSHHSNNDSMPLMVWIDARDAITSAIRILDIDARLNFVDLLLSAFKKGKGGGKIAFITLFASIILITSNRQIFGTCEQPSDMKNYIIFKITDSEPVVCKRHNV